MRRTATITLHWLTLVLLVLVFAGGQNTVLAWGFVISSLAMCALALVKGLMNGPGPKLDGALRAAHPWLNRGMYLGLAYVALATLSAELGGDWPGPPLPALYFYLLSASALHAIFHLWRHTALGDGALRRITPKVIHGML